MNTKTVRFALLLALLFGTPIFATSETETPETKIIIDENDSEEAEDTNYESEIEKCKNLKNKILGNKFDAKRIALVTSLGAVNLATVMAFFVATKLNIDTDLFKFLLFFSAYGITTKIMYEKLLKKYECTEQIRNIGLLLPLYALFNKSVVCSNLKNILANYNEEEIPTCLKKQFDALAEEYQTNNDSLTMTNNELLELIMDIILPELNKILNPQTPETSQN